MTTRHNFYPRPPRGGRRSTCCPIGRQNVFLSTPSARRATSRSSFRSRPVAYFYPRPPRGGRPLIAANARPPHRFLSTPSARRATIPPLDKAYNVHRFLSTPSARRATDGVCIRGLAGNISIHALREEGDVDKRFYPNNMTVISIHALREEGDKTVLPPTTAATNFYPRPPRGGRPCHDTCEKYKAEFLSTPSARRATSITLRSYPLWTISIHALREEGDPQGLRAGSDRRYFYPRPPRGGRRGQRGHRRGERRDFYPRPPRGGRRGEDVETHRSVPISIHALREEGDSKNRDKISIFKQIIQHSARI